ncbi:helix-turn-helix domain-containing protein [Myxococcota bacterium]|nr:helix-turn-helix domain-containing protein [Myxococcota bacterium]
MPRPPARPATRLGAAIQERRKPRTLREVAEELAVSNATLSHLERGTHRPSADTARKLATWLGWTVEEVLVAADEPVAG